VDPAGHHHRQEPGLRRGDRRAEARGRIPAELEQRPAKDLNNRLESDHGKLKRLIRPTLGFQSMRTARATIKGFEVMRMVKKGQFSSWIEAVGGGTEVRFISRLFGLYA
jgi:transposase, IS6 family